MTDGALLLLGGVLRVRSNEWVPVFFLCAEMSHPRFKLEPIHRLIHPATGYCTEHGQRARTEQPVKVAYQGKDGAVGRARRTVKLRTGGAVNLV